MIVEKTPGTESAIPASTERMSLEELGDHAQRIGIPPELITVRDDLAPDYVTIAIAKPDGRVLRRVVPRESWSNPAYRSSLIREMASLLS